MSTKKRAQITAKRLVQSAEEGEFKHYNNMKRQFLHDYKHYISKERLTLDAQRVEKFINSAAILCHVTHHQSEEPNRRTYERKKSHFRKEANREYESLW